MALFDAPWPEDLRLQEAVLLLEKYADCDYMHGDNRCTAKHMATSMCYMSEYEDRDWNHFRTLECPDLWKFLKTAIGYTSCPKEPHRCLAFQWVKEDVESQQVK